MTYEYKAVGAPEKGKRAKGARTGSERAAVAFEEVLRDETRDGWEYLRTDILPVNEKNGWFGRPHETHRAVMVFRRALDWDVRKGDRTAPSAAPQPEARPLFPRHEPQLRAVPPQGGPREPTISDSPELRLTDPVQVPGQVPGAPRRDGS